MVIPLYEITLYGVNLEELIGIILIDGWHASPVL